MVSTNSLALSALRQTSHKVRNGRDYPFSHIIAEYGLTESLTNPHSPVNSDQHRCRALT